MFKYIIVAFVALFAIVAAKPGYVAPAVAYTAAAYPAAAAYSAYSAPLVSTYSGPAVAAYSGYPAYSQYYGAGYGAAYRYY